MEISIYYYYFFFLKFGLSLNQNLTAVKKIHWATNKNNVRISQTVTHWTMKQEKGAGDFLSLTNCLPDTARKSDVTTLRVLCCNSDQVLWLKRLLIGIPPVNIYFPICETESRPKCKVFCELPRGQIRSLPNVCDRSLARKLENQTDTLRSFVCIFVPLRKYYLS